MVKYSSWRSAPYYMALYNTVMYSSCTGTGIIIGYSKYGIVHLPSILASVMVDDGAVL